MRGKLLVGLGLVGAAVLVAALWPAIERVVGRKRLRFPYLSRPIAAETYTALAGKPGWAKSELEVAPGIKLRGLVRKPSSAASPWVLFYPGNDESQLERGQSFLIGLGGDQDFGLAVFPYRGYDASDGKSELEAMRGDAPVILSKFCETAGIKPAQVHLAGFSIGGHFSVVAAGGAATRGARAASLTLWAPVSDIIMYNASPWEKLTRGEDYQTTPYLAEVPAPVLVLQGSADRTLDGNVQGKAIAQALGDKAKYQELAGVDHVPLLSHEPALAAMRQFVLEHTAK